MAAVTEVGNRNLLVFTDTRRSYKRIKKKARRVVIVLKLPSKITGFGMTRVSANATFCQKEDENNVFLSNLIDCKMEE